MRIRNLTPHDINVIRDTGTVTIVPDGDPPRIEVHTRPAPDINGIPTVITESGELIGLPAPEVDTYLIVSSKVADRAGELGRDVADLLIPYGQVRNAKGQPIGCTALGRISKSVLTDIR